MNNSNLISTEGFSRIYTANKFYLCSLFEIVVVSSKATPLLEISVRLSGRKRGLSAAIQD